MHSGASSSVPLLTKQGDPEINVVISNAPLLSTRPEMNCSTTCELKDAPNDEESLEKLKSRKKLMQAICLSFLFMVIEIIGGCYANSLAVLTDAAHLLSDIAGFAISLFALWMTSWESSAQHSFGYHRIEILGALISMQLIWMITGILIYEAIIRLIYYDEPVNGKVMFLTAVFGIFVNILMTVILGHDHGHSHGHNHGHSQDRGLSHDHDHDHDHNHDHDHDHAHDHDKSHGDSHNKSGSCENTGVVVLSDKKDEKKRNINVEGAYLHVLGDLFQSIGVAIGGAIIWAKPEWKIVDLICTLMFSALVLFTTLQMLKNISNVLMESTPHEIDATELQEGLKRLEGVVDVHELHIWTITLGKVVFACHVRTDSHDNDEVLHRVLQYCENKYGITHATVQVERVDSVAE